MVEFVKMPGFCNLGPEVNFHSHSWHFNWKWVLGKIVNLYPVIYFSLLYWGKIRPH